MSVARENKQSGLFNKSAENIEQSRRNGNQSGLTKTNQPLVQGVVINSFQHGNGSYCDVELLSNGEPTGQILKDVESQESVFKPGEIVDIAKTLEGAKIIGQPVSDVPVTFNYITPHDHSGPFGRIPYWTGDQNP